MFVGLGTPKVRVSFGGKPQVTVENQKRCTVAIVVHKDTLVFGIPAQRLAELLHVLNGGVEAVFIFGL